MNILSLDYGNAYIGTAVGNTSDNIAFPRTSIQNNDSLYQTLCTLCSQENIHLILIGKPVMLSGEVSQMQEAVFGFAETLQSSLLQNGLNIKIESVDERFSSVIAEQKLRGMKKKKKKEQIHAVSAQMLLEEYFKRY